MNDVYVRVCDLGSPENILRADLYHHHTCYTSYIRKYESSLCSKEKKAYSYKLTRKRGSFYKIHHFCSKNNLGWLWIFSE